VGTQVSGTIQKLYVDYNSRVKKGQVIAIIDPSLFNAQLEQSRGSHLNAQANLKKAKADEIDAKRTMERNRQLLKEGVVAQSDFDAAETKFAEAQATVAATEAGIRQTRGSLAQAETNLHYSIIRSPVDGTVISRNVDVGQTVAASFQTPTLFTIAQDLTKMQIETSIDEADIGKIKTGQSVRFTVDAYPDSSFKGNVVQIRSAPVITQNVVTYVVVVGVDNGDLRLKPGMTANVTVEVGRKDNVLKIPSAALRFIPRSPEKGAKEAAKPAGAPGRKEKRSGPKVYLLTETQQPKAVPIKTGLSGDNFVELESGELKENDQVIVEQVVTDKKKSSMGGGPPMGPRF
jgi:HlyD family secretion protein